MSDPKSPAPALHPSMRYVRTVHGERCHVTNVGASRTHCGREWRILLEYEPGIGKVCARCAEMVGPLYDALGLLGKS